MQMTPEEKRLSDSIGRAGLVLMAIGLSLMALSGTALYLLGALR